MILLFNVAFHVAAAVLQHLDRIERGNKDRDGERERTRRGERKRVEHAEAVEGDWKREAA